MNLGDALSEQFRLKAVLIRLNYGIAVAITWLILALIVLCGRIFVTYFLLKEINAPKYVWIIFFSLIPLSILVEQVESRSKP
mgnify:CR=1 FL=1